MVVPLAFDPLQTFYFRQKGTPRKASDEKGQGIFVALAAVANGRFVDSARRMAADDSIVV